ncbi:MAG: cupin domain-containing protein [Cryobacterium sp.]|nr:cupin domain-containing protein [Cryobacterium sp.]
MSANQAHSTLQFDTTAVRITLWEFPPGTQTGWHLHEHDYAVVPVTSGRLTVESDEASVDNELQAGVTYMRTRPVRHNVRNDGTDFISFVELEFKSPDHRPPADGEG